MNFDEILLILIVALLVLGPKQIPQIMGKFGKYFSVIKQLVQKSRNEIEQQIKLAELEHNLARAKEAEEKQMGDDEKPLSK